MSTTLPSRPSLPPPRGASWGAVRRMLIAGCVLYLVMAGMIVLLQRKLIYHPLREAVAIQGTELAAHDVKDVQVPTEDGLSLHGWLIRSPVDDAPQKHERSLVLYFQGNAAHRGRRARQIAMLGRLGCDVLIVDYRGYGVNEGSPSESGLLTDARAVWRHATERLATAPERILIYGESLGGGVAVALAAEVCRAGALPRGLIVQSSFSSLVDAARFHFRWLPVNWLLVDRFPSRERIADVLCPILLLHGDRDQIVPYELGQDLFAAAPGTASNGVPKRMVTLEDTGHNDIMHVAAERVHDAIAAFQSSIAASTSAR